MNQDFKKLMEEAFGPNLTLAQLWALVKFAKNARLRCRNNTAFNNMMGRAFPYATFRTVTKSRPSRTMPGTMEQYPGLEISIQGVKDSRDETD